MGTALAWTARTAKFGTSRQATLDTIQAAMQSTFAAAADASRLLANHAVLFTPDRGAHAGETFLIVDANGTAGYQAREDFVFRLDNATNLGNISTSTFT